MWIAMLGTMRFRVPERQVGRLASGWPLNVRRDSAQVRLQRFNAVAWRLERAGRPAASDCGVLGLYARVDIEGNPIDLASGLLRSSGCWPAPDASPACRARGLWEGHRHFAPGELMTTFLHVGTHKTGTTSIQRFARSNEQELRRLGLHYPSYRLIGRPGHYGHHHFAHAVSGEFSERFKAEEDIVRFVEAIGTGLERRENVLISAEPIYRHILGEGDIWEKKTNYLGRLRDYLKPLMPVRVVLVVRRQDTFALSLYQEEIKAKKQSKTFREFVESKRPQFDYVRHFDIFKEVFGRVDLLCYERISEDGGLIRRFFGHIGVRLSESDTSTAPRNQSLPPAILQ